jgi:Domain of unknown function (DUF4365)
MTAEQIKEQLSNRFIGILAVNRGFLIDKPESDFGVDYQLKKTYTYQQPNGKQRHTVESRYIDIQLKATTENSIIDEPTQIKYDLEAKSYNDLVQRQENGTAPLILILFILPHDTNLWVDIDLFEVKLRKHAYWYQPPTGSTMTDNEQRIRITIPKSNVLGLNCFPDIYNQLYP